MLLGSTALLARPADDHWQRTIDGGTAARAGRHASRQHVPLQERHGRPGGYARPFRRGKHIRTPLLGSSRSSLSSLLVRSKPVRAPAEELALMH